MGGHASAPYSPRKKGLVDLCAKPWAPQKKTTNPTSEQTRDVSSSWWLNHPFEKYDRQNGNLPQLRVKTKNI